MNIRLETPEDYREVEELIPGCTGHTGYGLCIISPEGTVDINASCSFPMHSVVKFPQALYVADYLQGNDIPLDSEVVVRRNELMQDTWSPMLEGMDESRTFSVKLNNVMYGR